MSDNPPAGWYRDPVIPGGARYWDGSSWTERTQRLDGGSATNVGVSGTASATSSGRRAPDGSQGNRDRAEEGDQADALPARQTRRWRLREGVGIVGVIAVLTALIWVTVVPDRRGNFFEALDEYRSAWSSCLVDLQGISGLSASSRLILLDQYKISGSGPCTETMLFAFYAAGASGMNSDDDVGRAIFECAPISDTFDYRQEAVLAAFSSDILALSEAVNKAAEYIDCLESRVSRY